MSDTVLLNLLKEGIVLGLLSILSLFATSLMNSIIQVHKC